MNELAQVLPFDHSISEPERIFKGQVQGLG